MLHRQSSAPLWSPARWLAGREGALAGPSSTLLRYVLIAAILAGISCVYLWQVNDLSTLHYQTIELQNKARTLEHDNVLLAEQLAQWNSPAYVEKRSTEQGYVAAPARTIQAPTVALAPGEPGANR